MGLEMRKYFSSGHVYMSIILVKMTRPKNNVILEEEIIYKEKGKKQIARTFY